MLMRYLGLGIGHQIRDVHLRYHFGPPADLDRSTSSASAAIGSPELSRAGDTAGSPVVAASDAFELEVGDAEKEGLDGDEMEDRGSGSEGSDLDADVGVDVDAVDADDDLYDF